MDDRRRDGGTNFILRIKEQETRLTLYEHDDDDDIQLVRAVYSLLTTLHALYKRQEKVSEREKRIKIEVRVL